MFLSGLTLILCLYVLWKWFIMLKERKIINIPGPIPLPVLGNGLSILSKPTEFLNALQSLYDKYGDIVRVHLLSERYILIRHPDIIEEIVSNNNMNTKGNSYNFIKPFLGEGLLNSTGERWKNHRKFLTPAFHFNILQNFLPIFIKNEKILIDKLHSLPKGKPLDIFPIITLAALDNVIESVMGVSIDAQKHDESTYVKNIEIACAIAAERIRNILIAVDVIFNMTPYYTQQKKALDYLHDYTRKVIETRRQELKNGNITQLDTQTEFGTKNKYAFLDLLLLADVNGKRIPDEWIREEVDTFLFEGHDTTSSGVVYTLYCISQNPEVQQKIFEEQTNIFADDPTRDVTYSDLHQMKYLGLVIKEALRIYPAVPLIERMVTQDTVIAGHQLLKGTSVIIDIFHLHRHPSYYEDPLEFKPERFENETGSNAYNWIAFSAGSRNCIGQKFAIMEMKVILSGIVKNFKLLPVKQNIELTPNLILKTPNGVYIKIEERN